ncbi:hypothetical protein OSB04_015049 [Centaurea solstitialis]|uniref:START domain-containing protein n=1 Tax=Centaurea solstitialis TaxID=347529 RepID=A0AA38SZV2_9ASTR|nr:hypothetical protein OSB04_015049 [Centaurea solstitialis]
MATAGGGGGSSGSGEDSGKEEKVVGRPKFEHSGWVYHLGTRSIKRESCHRRFLHIKGKYVMMYKRDPNEHSGTKPIRRGVVGHTLVLEELGRRRVNDDDLYVLKFSNRLDEEKKGEIACATARETRKWMEALEQAKKQAEYELSQGSDTRKKLSMENEIDFERRGHRRRLKHYASGVKRLMSTKRGPESLIRRSLSLGVNRRASSDFCEGDAADVVEGTRLEMYPNNQWYNLLITFDCLDILMCTRLDITRNLICVPESLRICLVIRCLPFLYIYSWDHSRTSYSEKVRTLISLWISWLFDPMAEKENADLHLSSSLFIYLRLQLHELLHIFNHLHMHEAVKVSFMVIMATEIALQTIFYKCFQGSQGILVKAVGVVELTPDSAFEMILSLDQQQRFEWDTLTSDLELVESLSGNSDVVYGTYNPRYLTRGELVRETDRDKTGRLHHVYHQSSMDVCYSCRWKCKRDFIFSRQWFCGQDGGYTILQFPAVHKKKPPRSGYRRTKVNPSTWEIRSVNTSVLGNAGRCLITHMLEVHSKDWSKWKTNQSLKFEKSIPYALLHQVSGLKVYIGIKYAPKFESSTTLNKEVSSSVNEYEDDEVADQFYDAISAYSSEDDDDLDFEVPDDSKGQNMRLREVASCLDCNMTRAPCANDELDPTAFPINLDCSHFSGTMRKGKNETDDNCWTCPSGAEFMIRGKTYLQNSAKVPGGDPLLKLIAVDWFKVDNPVSKVALNPRCLLQSDAGKKLPFVLVMNLQVPAKPNYSLVLYFAADRPVAKNSLLGRFIDESDSFRESRFKLIPRIVEGYWMVKRAVGTKACLLGKALTCHFLRQDNFLEIDVDVGSSSVARSVIGIVLGYVTNIVVDLAILIEGKVQEELPEYILGTVRLSRVRLESAVPLER